MSQCCKEIVNTCVIRGDNYALDIALSDGYEEVVENPDDYEARMVFRQDQRDALPDLLVLTSSSMTPDDPLPGQYPVEYYFRATTDQTEALPPYDIVHFVELRSLDGTYVRRLFQGKASMMD